MKKAIGVSIILAVLVGLFVMMALERGWLFALTAWGVAFVLSALLFVGVKLACDD